jgi:arginyl-tRNA synthetase
LRADHLCAVQVIDMPNKQIASVNFSRLKLCDATAKVMAKGFDILGLKYVSRM